VKVSAFADVEDHGSCIGKLPALSNYSGYSLTKGLSHVPSISGGKPHQATSCLNLRFQGFAMFLYLHFAYQLLPKRDTLP
jgi:hypothetical protein